MEIGLVTIQAELRHARIERRERFLFLEVRVSDQSVRILRLEHWDRGRADAATLVQSDVWIEDFEIMLMPPQPECNVFHKWLRDRVQFGVVGQRFTTIPLPEAVAECGEQLVVRQDDRPAAFGVLQFVRMPRSLRFFQKGEIGRDCGGSQS